MTAIKKTLLEIVQDILSDTDGEPINSISDTLEGEQIATIIEHTFYDIIALRDVPEHQELIKLTPLSNNLYPTHFEYPTNVKEISHVWYDTSDDSTFKYTPVYWCDPLEFIKKMDGLNSDYLSITELVSGTKLRIRNNKHPEYYTSFDDEYIVMDSFKATVDDTLQESKIRALGVKYPIFNRFDDEYVPDIDASFFPHLISEARSRAMDFFKGGVTQKAEQAARRAKTHLQNDKFNTTQDNIRNRYGRHS